MRLAFAHLQWATTPADLYLPLGIDKTSSQELSEAINSMYQWYTNAAFCYVYLSDVSGNCPSLSDDSLLPLQLRYIDQFEESRWFTRGWTLQELIAPRVVLFYGCRWNAIGSLPSLLNRVSAITGIQPDVLDHTRPLADLNIARRLSWAAKRNTTRTEDQAYCLLGIFDISMPLVYGEGPRAFMRLQELLIQQSTDQSIFAWDAPLGFIRSGELLFAPSPHCFVNSGKVRRRRGTASESAFRLSNRGLEITLPIVRRRLDQDPSRPYVTLGILDCKYEDSPDLLALVMSQHRFNIQRGSLGIEVYVSGFERLTGCTSQFSRLLSVKRELLADAQLRPLTITRDLRIQPHMQPFHENPASFFPVSFMADEPRLIPSLRDVYPADCWYESSRTMKLLPPRSPIGGIVVDTEDRSILITFGLAGVDLSTLSFQPPATARRIYSIVFIDPECPIQPHLRSSVRSGSKDGRDAVTLQLNTEHRLLAQLCGGALAVSVERVGVNNILLSPSSASSQPSSPTASVRRPSSSSSSSRRRDSLFPDGRLERSDSSYEWESRVHRTPKFCENCRDVVTKEQAKSKRDDEMESERKRAEKQQKLKSRATQAGMGITIGSFIADAADFLV